MNRSGLAIFAATALLLGACAKSPPSVDAARIENAAPREWLSYGRTYDEQRFSPLERITDKNVAELGLLWFHDLEVPRGAEATPRLARFAGPPRPSTPVRRARSPVYHEWSRARF
jgi:glucose dehydrogenase